jgi:ribosome-interacting GTPase 1
MPANLTPQYMAADKKFKAATTAQQRLEALEEMLSSIPKHKGTEKMQADLKRRIAKARQETQRRKGAARARSFFQVEREGAGQIVLAGVPNSGKSSLVAALSNAEPEVGDYPFTTRVPLTGMVAFEDVQIQLIDLPPISPEMTEGWFYAIIRGADGVLVVVDLADPDILASTQQLFELLAAANVEMVPPTRARSAPREVPAVFVAAKLDAPGAADTLEVFKEFYGDRLPVLPVSARQDVNLAELRRTMLGMLNVIRVYSKKPGKKADMEVPYILKRGTPVLEAAGVVHKDFGQRLRYARLWRRGEIEGQMVGRDTVLEDGDVLELHA